MDTSGSGESGGVLGGALPEKRFHAPFSLDFSIPKPRSLSCRNFLKARFRFSSIVTLLLLFAYLLGCAWKFFAWALPEAQGIGQIRLGADPATYYAIAKAIENGKMAMVLLSLTQNLIGPISVTFAEECSQRPALFFLPRYSVCRLPNHFGKGAL